MKITLTPKDVYELITRAFYDRYEWRNALDIKGLDEIEYDVSVIQILGDVDFVKKETMTAISDMPSEALEKDSPSIYELPLTNRTKNALVINGINTLADLRKHPRPDFRATLEGIGIKTADEISRYLDTLENIDKIK